MTGNLKKQTNSTEALGIEACRKGPCPDARMHIRMRLLAFIHLPPLGETKNPKVASSIQIPLLRQARRHDASELCLLTLSWFLKARFCFTTPFLFFQQRTFVTVCRCETGYCTQFLYKLNLLRTSCGGRYATLHSVGKPYRCLDPRLIRCYIPPLLFFTHRGYRPFCIEASLSLGLQGCHTKVLLALLH